MKTKSYFKKLLKEALITIIIPIVTIIILYFHMENVIRGQILLTHENTLNQFFELVDSYIGEAVSRSYDIAENELCKQYMSDVKTDKGYQRVKIVEELKKYYDDKLEDIFIYYPKEQRAISGRTGYGSFEIDMYLKVNHPKKDRLKFDKLLYIESYTPVLCTLPDSDGNNYLCMVMRRHVIGNVDKDFLVIQIFSHDFITNILERQLVSDGGTLLLFDEQQSLLLSADNKEYYHLGDYIGADTPFETNINGNKYMMQVKKAENINGFYAFAISFDYFWEELSGTRMICLLGGTLCIIVSILMAWRSSKRVYKPVNEIILNVEKKSLLNYDSETVSEFEYLEQIFEQDNVKKNELSILAEKGEKERREQFILSLLGDDIKMNGKADDSFAEYGIKLFSDSFMIVLFYVEGNTTMETDLMFFTVDNVFSELCNQVHMGYFARMTGNMAVMLVNFKKTYSVGNRKLLWENGQTFFKKHGNITVTIALGNVGEGITSIRQSFREAEHAMKYRYIMGQGCCIDYLDICDRSFNYIVSVESKLSQIIMGFLNQADVLKSAESVVIEALEMYQINEMSSIETVDGFRYELFGVLHKIMIQIDYSSAEERNDLLKRLMKQPSLKQLEKEFVFLLALLKDAMVENVMREDVCDCAWNYILNNYSEPELSVSRLGEVFGISPSYLSKLFRKKYGLSILDCIAQTRIKNAKEALRNTNMSITEISEQVGFLSPQAFVKIFKKYEGITPGIYRDLL